MPDPRPAASSTRRGASLRRGPARVEHVMGMPVGIDVRDGDVGPSALDAAYAWLRFVDATFSTHRAESEISRLNRGDLDLATCSPEVREVLARCDELREETGGYFDAHAAAAAADADASPAGDRPVDPSGYVKGWAIGATAEILERSGARNFAVNAGGDVFVHGRPAPGARWRVGVQHPSRRDRVAAVVEADDLAVATSGAYERGEHIVDPHTALPPHELLSMTVTGPDIATADAYATAAFAMGADGPSWVAGLRGYAGFAILADGTTLSTPGFDARRA
jgi:thiamine biosynthesis lipoprotein